MLVAAIRRIAPGSVKGFLTAAYCVKAEPAAQATASILR